MEVDEIIKELDFKIYKSLMIPQYIIGKQDKSIFSVWKQLGILDYHRLHSVEIFEQEYFGRWK